MGKEAKPIIDPQVVAVLRVIMASILYSEIRHEKFLQHNLTDLRPETLYAATFEAVDGLLAESKK